MTLWCIETTGKPGVVHLATEGTTEPLCQAIKSRGTAWRTPPKQIKGDRPCKNCAAIVEKW